jgi:hypothetical protein
VCADSDCIMDIVLQVRELFAMYNRVQLESGVGCVEARVCVVS